ncbi:MAG: hypothetical protein MZV49_08875 [Rhodopseudomonas palustris]|nr:hypothetical protein [Rhodopseudomonas palustris]
MGTVVYKRKVAQRRLADSVIWEAVARGGTIYNHDAIRTTADSEATITFLDSSTIGVGERFAGRAGLRIGRRAHRLHRGIARGVELRSGGVRPRRSCRAGESRRRAAQGADDRVGQDGARRLQGRGRHEEGQGRRRHRGRHRGHRRRDLRRRRDARRGKLRTGRGEGRGGREGRGHRRPGVAGVARARRAFLLARPGGGQAAFTWRTASAGPFTVEVSADRSFAAAAARAESTERTASLQVSPGSWWWRVRAAGSPGAPVAESQAGRFTVVPDAAPQPLAPPDGAVFPSRGAPKPVRVAWGAVDFATAYAWEASTDPAFLNRFASGTTQGDFALVTPKAEGPVYWRVAPVFGFGGLGQRHRLHREDLPFDQGGGSGSARPGRSARRRGFPGAGRRGAGHRVFLGKRC